MCGICGIVDRDPGRVIETSRLESMREVLRHRGPDDAGIWTAPGVGLGHRRLAIIDVSSAGRQPMLSDDHNCALTFNGEIYNFHQLRGELEQEGCRFYSRTDSEVVLRGFQRWGLEKLLRKLVGIFAFAIWEQGERRLFLARDHFGVKPLYWWRSEGKFLFASEIKALFAAGVEKAVDVQFLDELLIFRFVAGPYTIFRGIQRLLPGHYLTWKDGVVREVEYYSLLTRLDGKPVTFSEWYNCFSQTVRLQSISDVPLGTLLSGGLDSSAVTAELARHNGPGVKTFTVSVETGPDEATHARQVADRWRCDCHILHYPATDVLEGFFEAQQYSDEPLAHANEIYLFAISRLAQRYVKVLLSGEGADETLAGYVRYMPLRFPYSLSMLLTPVGMPFRIAFGFLKGRGQKFGRFLSLNDLDDYILFNSADVLPVDLQRLGKKPGLNFEWRRETLKKIWRVTSSPLRALMLYDVHTFLVSLLDRNDRMTMAASIECRVPFLDHRLVEKSFAVPEAELFSGWRGKHPLRSAMSRILPREVITRPKWGFGAPLSDYLRGGADCRHFLKGLISSEVDEALAIPNLRGLIEEFLHGDDTAAPLIRQVFYTGLWWKTIL